MIGTRTETHDADADLDYGWDLTTWLPTDDDTPDTIQSVTAELYPATAGTVHGVTVVDSGHQVVAWVKDLTDDAILIFHVTTTAGRKDDAHVELLLEDRDPTA